MQSLTRRFSMGLAVAFVVVVLAVSLRPAYGAMGDGVDFKFKVKNNTDCVGNGANIWAKFFKWDKSNGSSGELKRQKEVAPGKSRTFKFNIKAMGKDKLRYFELRADGAMIAKGVIRMEVKPGTKWVQFDGYDSDNFKVIKSNKKTSFTLNIKMDNCQ